MNFADVFSFKAFSPLAQVIPRFSPTVSIRTEPQPEGTFDQMHNNNTVAIQPENYPEGFESK